jgi:hypothetical protein
MSWQGAVASATLLLDTLCGAGTMHAVTAPASLKELQRSKAATFSE